MAPSVSGTYQLEKNENLYQYLIAIGLPEDRAKESDSQTSKIQVSVDGNKVSLKSESRGMTTTFVIDQEIDEEMPNGTVLKSTATLDANNLTIKSKDPDGKVTTRVYNFTDDGMILTMTREDLKTIAAKRIYKRI